MIVEHDHGAVQDRERHGDDASSPSIARITARSCARLDGKWVAIKLMQEPVKALTQSYTRTKAHRLRGVQEDHGRLHTNSSNNTIFADADGNIAYFHANFIPRRDTTLRLDEAGRRQRSGDGLEGAALGGRDRRNVDQSGERLGRTTPTTGRGRRRARAARRQRTIPKYVENGVENAARRARDDVLLSNRKDFTLDGLIGAAFDSYQPCFEKLIPALVKAYDAAPAPIRSRPSSREQIALLRDVGFALARDVGADVARDLLRRRS